MKPADCSYKVSKKVTISGFNLYPKNGTYQKYPHGFTLVELMVVIAIITILAALLFPTLQRSIYLAKDVTCMNGHRQLSTALLMYTDDNKGFLPYTITNTGIPYITANNYIVPSLQGIESCPAYTGLGTLYGQDYISSARLLYCSNEDKPELLEGSQHPTMGVADMQKKPPPRQIDNDIWSRTGGWSAQFVASEKINRIKRPDDGLVMCAATGKNSYHNSWRDLHQRRGFCLSFIDNSAGFFSYSTNPTPPLWGGNKYSKDYPRNTLSKASKLYRGITN